MVYPSQSPSMTQASIQKDTGFVRGLNLFDSTMVVIGVMIGSGIFIVSADMSRLINSPGWMLMAWVITGVLTLTAVGTKRPPIGVAWSGVVTAGTEGVVAGPGAGAAAGKRVASIGQKFASSG